METRGAIIVFLCITYAQVSFQLEQQCSMVVLRNSTDPMEVSFYNHMEQIFKEKKTVEPISAYLNTGQFNVSVMFSVDYNISKVIVKPKNIILETNSNYSNPDFFVAKYHGIDKNKVLIKLKKMFIKQSTNDNIYNIILSDKIINTYLQKIINVKSLMTVHITVTAQGFHFNFIEIHYVGKKDCFLPYDNSSNQRHKRSVHSKRDEHKLHKRKHVNKIRLSERRMEDDDNISIFKDGLSVLSPEDFHPILRNKYGTGNNKHNTYNENEKGNYKRTIGVFPINPDDSDADYDNGGAKRSIPPGDDCSDKRAQPINACSSDDYNDNDGARRSIPPGDDCSNKRAQPINACESDYDNDGARRSVPAGDDCSNKRAQPINADDSEVYYDNDGARRSVPAGDDCSNKRSQPVNVGDSYDNDGDTSVPAEDKLRRLVTSTVNEFVNYLYRDVMKQTEELFTGDQFKATLKRSAAMFGIDPKVVTSLKRDILPEYLRYLREAARKIVETVMKETNVV